MPSRSASAARTSATPVARRVARAAAALAGLGVRRGDAVAYLGLSHPLVLVLLFACARLGAMFVPHNWRLAPREHARCWRIASLPTRAMERRGLRPFPQVSLASPDYRDCADILFVMGQARESGRWWRVKEDSFGSFFLQLGILLPSLFFAWYMSAPFLAQLVAYLLDPILFFLWPDNVFSVAAADSKIVIFLRLPLRSLSPNGLASVAYTLDKGVLVNVLTYSYGVPLYLALSLASSASMWQHLARTGLGILIVGSGVCFAMLASLVFAVDSDPRVQPFRITDDPETNAFAIRYVHFIGFSLVPRMIPLVAWALLYRDAVRSLLEPLLRRFPAETADGARPTRITRRGR